VDQGLWQGTVREGAYLKNLGSYNRYEERIYAEKGEGVSVI